MAERVTLQASESLDHEEQRMAAADIGLAAIALVAKLPTSNQADALAILDQARVLVVNFLTVG